jgi:acyl-coenzyme A synthetase/AMP-(fatty) acid ligase
LEYEIWNCAHECRLTDIYNAATTFVDENINRVVAAKVAIYYQDQKITYQEVFEKVNRTGNALKDLGIEIENRVLVILPDSPEFAYSFFRRDQDRRRRRADQSLDVRQGL